MSTQGRQVSGERSRGFHSPEWNATGPPSRDSREAANSADKAAYKRLTSADAREQQAQAEEKKANLLLISFVSMLVIGSGNKIFQKLQTIPMYNYPNFLNLLTTFVYMPLSFMYIIPVAKFGWLNGTISQEQMDLPKKPFAIMGFLDCLAGIMQIFAATYLPGPLLILISQMAIPISMLLSKTMLGAKYKPYQYVGAIIVFFGIITVLAPQFNGTESEVCQAIHRVNPYNNSDCAICDDISLTTKAKCLDNDECEWSVQSSSGAGSGSSGTLIWATVMVLSCIPMTLSSIYKEIALGETELDPVFLNGWIAVFQFLFSIPLAIPAAMASDPPIYPAALWQNMKDGMQCYLGTGSIDSECGVHGDSYCDEYSIPFVNVYLLFNVSYNVLIILILKFGNANILWLAMTIMVPIGNLAFALPFMPSPSQVKPTDVAGLVVIMGGLGLYRFGESAWARFFGDIDAEGDEDSGHKPLLSPVLEENTPDIRRANRLSSEEPEKVGGVGRVGKSF